MEDTRAARAVAQLLTINEILCGRTNSFDAEINRHTVIRIRDIT